MNPRKMAFRLFLSTALVTAEFLFQQSPVLAAAKSKSVVDGTLEVLISDDFKGKRSHTSYFVTERGGGRRLEILSRGNLHGKFLTGDRVIARGHRKDNRLHDAEVMLAAPKPGAGGGSGASTSGPGPVIIPGAIGAQTTLVILVNFQDNPSQPYTPDEARNIFFGVTGNTTTHFFLENSYQQTWLTGDVTGWHTLPLFSNTCDTNSIQSQARAAAIGAGVNISAYQHLVYAFPRNGCGWWGLSSIGGAPSNTFINGTPDFDVIAHELGHAFGLWHSNALNCGTEVTGNVMASTNPPPAGTCWIHEYGDIYDSMASRDEQMPAHFNAFQKERLGWLNTAASPKITTITTSGVYALKPIELGGLGPNALKILKSIDVTTGAKTFYYIEFRQAVGFDSYLSSPYMIQFFRGLPTILGGVTVRLGTEAYGNTSHLLDMHPLTDEYGSEWFYNAPLLVGQSYTDQSVPSSGMTVSLISVNSDEASVSVTVSTPNSGSGGTKVTGKRR